MNLNHYLSVRTDFSLGESTLSIDEIIEAGKNVGASSIGLVDTMNVNAMIEFTKKAKAEGIKPIIGCRLRVVDDPYDKTPKKKRVTPNNEFYPKVYVKNEQGIKDLFESLTIANQEDHFYFNARLSYDEFLDLIQQGNVAVSTGDFQGLFSHPDHASLLRGISETIPDISELFVELVAVHTPLWDTMNARAIDGATDLGLRTLLTRPMLYSDPDEGADVLDALVAVQGNMKMTDPWRPEHYVRDFAFKPISEVVKDGLQSAERNKKRCGDDVGRMWKQAMENIEALADICQFEWQKQDVSLPKLVADEYAELLNLVKQGWHERLTNETMGYKPTDLEPYKKRLTFEITTLKNMGFENYFLVVRDLVMWSKNHDIMVGPGRGSVGGSLVAYLLGITDVDPLRFGLIFERFINPERLDLPDADLDFMSSRRHEVIDYLRDKYGEDRVAGISNYASLAAAGALSNVARVNGLKPQDYSCSKLVPSVHGSPIPLEQAVDEVPEIEAFKSKYPAIFSVATKLQGKMRSLGQHAAGVVVAGEPIKNRAVVEKRSGSWVVNWDKRVVEEQGLIKIDVLGLSTLDVLAIARRKIEERTGERIDYTALPLDDPKVLEAFGKGDTTGIFQFESPGMKKLLRDIAYGGQLTFDDLAAATALYRPGPMDSGMLDDYVAITQGVKHVAYEHPLMEEALKDTRGVLIYQESVMQLARDLAGFTMAEADHLRKAMGKKDAKKMAEMREKWVEGCGKTAGMEGRKAAALFEKIEKFAAYGFNKSHSVEYSMISYMAMWVKQHYPAEFYAASLSIMDEDKTPNIVADAQTHDIYVVPPDINVSTQEFEIAYDATREQLTLVTPFNRIRGVSHKSGAAIIEARNATDGSFESRADFEGHVEKRRANARVRDALDKVGAFANVEAGQLPARHPDRLKDQIHLMPGLIVETLKADRKIEADKFVKAKVIHLVNEMRACEGCSLKGGVHPVPRLGRTPKFMVVTDCPNGSEEIAARMMDGDSCDPVKQALKKAGLSVKDGYFTSLVKSKKTDKMLTNEQINGCSGYLKKEIEILKPPVIVALGGAATRFLVPSAKGGYAELCGKTIYDANLDATVVMGLNPLIVYPKPEEQERLDEVFQKVAQMVT